MDNTQETLTDDGQVKAERKQTRSPNCKSDSSAQNQQEESKTEYPKWKVCLVIVLAVLVFSYGTRLVYLIPAVLKCLPTSERALDFFLDSPTYAKNTIGFDSELWINRYVEHISLSIVVIFCIVCLVVFFSKFTVKKISKENLEKLDAFFDELNKKELKLLGHWKAVEIKEINVRITNAISNIVFESFKDDHTFHFQQSDIHKHIRLVGSVAEGTKIRNPDEFDFIFVWPHFADSNTIVEYINKSPDDINIWYSGNSVRQLKKRNVITKKSEQSVSHLISPSNLFIFFYKKISKYVSHLPNCYCQVSGPVVTLFFDEMVLESGKRVCIDVDLLPVISLSKSKAYHLLSQSLRKDVIDKVKYIYLSHIPTGRKIVSKSDGKTEGKTEGKTVINTCFTEKDTFSICLPHVENILIKYLSKMQPKLIISYQILKDMQRALCWFVHGEDETSPYFFYMNSYQLKCLILEMAFEIKQPHTEMSLSTIIIALCEKILLSYSHAAGKGNVTFPTLLTRIKNRYSLRSSAQDELHLRSTLKFNRDILVGFFENIVNGRIYNFQEYLEQYNDFVKSSGESSVKVTKRRSFQTSLALQDF